MEDLTGRQFGPYRIVAPLGEGGMAAVYKAYQASVDRYVALKILPRYFASDPEFVGRFIQEARMLAKLQHPRILAVHDFGETDGYTYIVMPLVDTGSLADWLVGNPLPLPQISQVIAQVAEALDYAHSFGVVHRDVKPSNVLVDRQGNCLLTDFGIAKMVEGTSHFTRTGGTIGTPAYMSPEQIQGEKLDGRSDVYSLGIVLYEMATGRPPYRAETPPAVFVKHLHDPLPPPHIYNSEIPEAVERVVLKALAKDRKDRFQTAGELADALSRAVGGQPVELAGVPAVQRMARTEAVPVAKAKRRQPVWLFALLGLAVVASLIGVVWAFTAKPDQVGTAVVTLLPTASAVATTRAPTAAVPTPTSRPAATHTPVPPTATRPPTPTPVQSAALLGAPTRGAPDPWGELVIRPGEPIRLAFVGPLTGEMAALGTSEKNAFELALGDGEDVYGFRVAPEAAFVADDGCSEQGRQAAADVVAQGNVAGVVGHACSVSCAAAGPVYEEAHLAVVSPSCSRPDLTESGWAHFNRVILREDRGSADFDAAVVQTSDYRDFVARYQERFGHPPSHDPLAAYAFDATRILIQAIRAVAAADEAGNLVIGRMALTEAVRTIPGFHGVTGPLSFDERGDRRLPREVAPSPEDCQPGYLRVGMVTDAGGIEDAGLNAPVWDGLLRAADTLPVCARFVASQRPEDIGENLVHFADQGFDPIVAPGFNLMEPLANVARQHPETRFVAVDFVLLPALDNVASILFRVDQAAFPAGYLAAAWAALQDPADPQVGYLGGAQIDRVEEFVVAYQAGVDYYNRQKSVEIPVRGVYTGRFDAPEQGKLEAMALFDAGVDVLFCAAGRTGLGGLTAAHDRSRWAIGVDVDQSLTVAQAQSVLLTSVLKRLDNAIYGVVEELTRGTFRGGRVYLGTLENGGVGLAPYHGYENQIPTWLKQEMEVIQQGIMSGTIDTGWKGGS